MSSRVSTGGGQDKEMTDYLSETESDTSSVMGDTYGDGGIPMKPPSPAPREQLQKRIESLVQENRVLKVELETYKLRVRTLQEENKSLKQASVLIQAKAEQEEEFISNTLLKKIQELKKEKELLALNYEQEEECLTNDLSRKLNQLRSEKAHLSATLQQEQESLVNKLMRKIRKLESETIAKQTHLDQIRREKVELENTLEQEQESLVNRLWKKMDKLEAEKRCLQTKLEHPVSAPPSPMDTSGGDRSSTPASNGSAGGNVAPAGGTSPQLQVAAPPTPAGGTSVLGVKRQRSTDAEHLTKHIKELAEEVARLKQLLKKTNDDNCAVTAQYAKEERMIREENLRLRRKLEMEVERRQELCRHLSESESSLEMEDERHFNELSVQGQIPAPPVASSNQGGPAPAAGGAVSRARTISSPIQFPVAGGGGTGRPVSPAMGGLNVNVSMASAVGYGPPSPLMAGGNHRCNACGSLLPHQLPLNLNNPAAAVALPPGMVGPHHSHILVRTRSQGGKFARPANPPTPKAASPAPSPLPSSGGGTGAGSEGVATTANLGHHQTTSESAPGGLDRGVVGDQNDGSGGSGQDSESASRKSS